MYFNNIFNFGTFYAYIISSLFNHGIIHRDPIFNYILGQQIECTSSLERWLSYHCTKKQKVFWMQKGFLDVFMVSSKRFLHNKITPGISVMYMDL